MITEFDIDMLHKTLAISKLSNANKRKVGAIISDKDMNIYGMGYNRMFKNCVTDSCETPSGDTYECVVHAEEDAVINYLKLNFASAIRRDLTIYVTYSPCMNCCKLIHHAGIRRVVYYNEHPINFKTPEVAGGISPKDFLESVGIKVERCLAPIV